MDVYGIQYVGLISASGRATGTRWFLVATCSTHWMEAREKAVVRPVSLPSACFLVSWVCGRPWPLAFCSGSVCWSGAVVRFWPSCFVWFRPPGLFQKRGEDPGHLPKDRVFSDRQTTCRAGSPWWPGMRGDDPRTDPLAGTPFYVRHYSGIGRGCWVLTLVFIVASSFFVFSSFARLFKPTGGGRWKNLHV